MTPKGRTRDLLTTADGRSVCFAQWGDLSGFPVVFMHGTPGGRLNRHPDEGVYVELGIRWITYDRPGYGGSDRLAGRSVVSCVTDVAAIVDALGIERFAVTGSSGRPPRSRCGRSAGTSSRESTVQRGVGAIRCGRAELLRGNGSPERR